MTHKAADGIHDDIAYMKTLAAEGRQAPVLVGPILVAAAVWFGAATIGQWLVALGHLSLSGWGVLGMWIGAAIGFAALLHVLLRRLALSPGSGTRDNVAIGAAWSACGYSIFGLWMVLMAYALSTGNWSPMALMPAVVMVAYGAAWLIAGQVASRSWMMAVGILSLAGAVALGWFAHTDWTYGIYLLLLATVALLPGLYLMKLAARPGN